MCGTWGWGDDGHRYVLEPVSLAVVLAQPLALAGQVTSENRGAWDRALYSRQQGAAMKPSEIVVGETYHNGRGEERTVAERFDSPKYVGGAVLWRNGMRHGIISLENFARWARGRVERR